MSLRDRIKNEIAKLEGKKEMCEELGDTNGEAHCLNMIGVLKKVLKED